MPPPQPSSVTFSGHRLNLSSFSGHPAWAWIFISKLSFIYPRTLWNAEVTLCFHSGAHHEGRIFGSLSQIYLRSILFSVALGSHIYVRAHLKPTQRYLRKVYCMSKRDLINDLEAAASTSITAEASSSSNVPRGLSCAPSPPISGSAPDDFPTDFSIQGADR